MQIQLMIFKAALSSLFLLCLLAAAPPTLESTLSQISKDHVIYINAEDGDVLTITTEHRLGTDPDFVYVFAPNGYLQKRYELPSSTVIKILLNSGTGVYKILPVNHTYIHDYSIPGDRGIVVEPLSHAEMIRVTGSADLYFQVPPDTSSMTFNTHSMWSNGAITVELYNPDNALIHTFNLPRQTFRQSYTSINPAPGMWRCRLVTPGYDAFGVWLEGVPNFFASTPSSWFEPAFYKTPAAASLQADFSTVVSSGAKVGVNWWLLPWNTTTYNAERDAILEARMDSARIGVSWAWREPENDNADPFDINWQGFNFSAHDDFMAAYYNDIVIPLSRVSEIPAQPVLLFHWDNIGSNAVKWQLDNPADWTQTQREEYAEFILATMIHTIAPDLQNPPGQTPAYDDFTYVELLNEPNLVMGNENYQAYIELVKTVGKRLREHSDPRINSLKIIAPGITPGWGNADIVMENWIGSLIDQADTYVDGVNWHQYGYPRIEECHRFAQDIAKVKQWLAARGDSVADEKIIMTELNQYGGGPTCRQQYDTFYASRWFAGACLSAMRGGMDILHFYKLVDDPAGSYKYKSLLYNDGPYNPPIFPGGPPHGRKPVYAAVKFINEHRLKNVVASTCDHPEIAHAVTRDDNLGKTTILLANLFDRTIELDITDALPPDYRTRTYVRQMYWLDKNGTGTGLLTKAAETEAGVSLTLKPQTIYAVEFRPAKDY